MCSRSRLLALTCSVALVAWGAAVSAALAQETPGQDATPELPPPVWISPTPDEYGVISVVVQPDESLWIIAARAGLTLPDLLTLNNLTENDVIRPGDIIIIGTGTPPPTAISPELFTPTITPPPPTLRPTQPPPAATICLTAFEDANQNRVRDNGEPTTAGVAFTVYNRDKVVANVITDGREEPHCVAGLAPGEYYVTRSILPGERLTTDGDWALVIANANTLYQAFGSIRSSATPVAGSPSAAPAGNVTASAPMATQPAAPTAADEPANGFLLWGGAGFLVLGGLLLLAAVLLLRSRRTRAGS